MALKFLRRLFERRAKTNNNHWKIAEDVKRVTISGRKFKELGSRDFVPHELGCGQFGTAVIGRVKFKDGTERRVAVKHFHKPLSDLQAHKYQEVIDELKAAGINMPKVGMYKLPSGEWVQVSSLFGSTKKGSKLFENSFSFSSSDFVATGEKATLEVFEQSLKIANLGYKPMDDIFVIMAESYYPLIMDFDLLVYGGKKKFNVVVKSIGDLYHKIKLAGVDERKLKALLVKNGNRKLVAAFEKYWAKHGI